MTNFSDQIKDHMPVICTNGVEFAVVDHLEGENSIKLSRDEHGNHHWIPISWVRNVDQAVHIDRPVDQAMREWSDSSPIDL